MKKCLNFILCAVLFTLSVEHVLAQAESESDFVKKTQQDIMLVGAAGGAGAVLGLSTLSFYETPSKHIRNVWTGAALGIIAGVVWVAYSSAQKSSEDMINDDQASVNFSTHERSLWAEENTPFLTMQSVQFGTQLWQTSF